jgi:hypothetical protein
MAPSNALTVEGIINRFPNPVLSKIDNEPTFEDIQITTRLLNSNAISIPSMAGGGAQGHLDIIMTQIEYATIAASPWVEPFNPNDIPIIPPGTKAVGAVQLARMHAECRRIYTNRISVEQSLKRLILEAYDNMYTSQLEDYLLQYANRSSLEILMHLKQTYGFINPTQLAENYNKMTAPINFQDPIETLFKQIEDGVRYANAGMQPYTEAKYINIDFLLILNTGAIPDACHDCQRRTPFNQTWADFRREFSWAQQEQRIISSTAGGTGYHTANVAEHYEPTPMPANTGFVAAMDNLDTATSADRETVATLTRAIATLTDKLKAKDIWAKKHEAEVRCLLGTQGNARPTTAAGPTNTYVRKSYKTNNENYFWSHGYQVGLNHTSANCTKKAPGHKNNTTKTNIMGGDTWGSEFLGQDGEVQIKYLSSQNFMNYLNFTPSIPSQSTALLDSGCTAHFLLANAKCSNKIPAATPLAVCLPTDDTIASTHTATLNMPSLPRVARQAHILPGLAQHSLLSVRQICDSGFSVTFTVTEVTVTNGESKKLTGLWDK